MRALLALVLLASCGDDSGATPPLDAARPVVDRGVRPDGSVPRDGDVADEGMSPTDRGLGQDAPAADDAGVPPVDGGLPDFPPDWPQSRGWTWVRSNEPFVSALSARMGAPPAGAVSRYFDDFNATAAHLWQTGMPDAIAGWKAARPDARWLSWVDRDGNSSANGRLLGGAPRPANLIAYQVGDEPRDRPHFDDIVAALARVREADPEPLRVFNFTYFADDIEGFLRDACAAGTTDIVSYDRYTYSNQHFETLMLFRDAAFACGVPAWRYMRAYRRSDASPSGPTDFRWDAFIGLLTGFTGHSWFIYNVQGGDAEGIPTSLFEGTEDWNAATTPQFDLVAGLNRELVVYGRAQTRLRSTGVAWAAERAIPGVHPPGGVPAWARGVGGDPFLERVSADGNLFQDVLLGFFDDRFGDRYLMVMNPNHEDGSFPNDSTTPADVRLTFDFSAREGVSTDRLLVLRPRGVVESLPLEGGELRVTIPAGDLLFLKYDTGRGFEGYR